MTGSMVFSSNHSVVALPRFCVAPPGIYLPSGLSPFVIDDQVHHLLALVPHLILDHLLQEAGTVDGLVR